MEFVLAAAVLCLSASTAVLASALPYLYWKCFRLEVKLEAAEARLQRQIDTLDEATTRLMEGIGVPAKE